MSLLLKALSMKKSLQPETDTMSQIRNANCQIPFFAPQHDTSVDEKEESRSDQDKSEAKYTNTTQVKSSDSDATPASADNVSTQNESEKSQKLLTVEDILDEALAESAEQNESSGSDSNKY